MILLDAAQNMDKVEQLLIKQDIIDATVEFLIAKTSQIAMLLAILFGLLTLGWHVLSNNIKNIDTDKDNVIDFKEILTIVALIFMISIYLPFSKVIMESIDWVNSLSAPTGKQSQLFDKYATNYQNGSKMLLVDITEDAYRAAANDESIPQAKRDYFQQKADELAAENDEETEDKTENDKSVWDAIYNAAKLILNPYMWLIMGFKAIMMLLAQLVRWVVLMFAEYALKVLFIIGPLTLAFSIFPFNRDKINELFGTILNIGMAFTVFNIMDHLFFDSFKNIYEASITEQMQNSGKSMALDFVLVIMYLTPFWLSSKIVGRGDAGKIVTKGVTLGAIALGAAFMGASSLAGGGGGGGNIQNAVGGMRDAFKDDDN